MTAYVLSFARTRKSSSCEQIGQKKMISTQSWTLFSKKNPAIPLRMTIFFALLRQHFKEHLDDKLQIFYVFQVAKFFGYLQSQNLL